MPSERSAYHPHLITRLKPNTLGQFDQPIPLARPDLLDHGVRDPRRMNAIPDHVTNTNSPARGVPNAVLDHEKTIAPEQRRPNLDAPAMSNAPFSNARVVDLVPIEPEMKPRILMLRLEPRHCPVAHGFTAAPMPRAACRAPCRHRRQPAAAASTWSGGNASAQPQCEDRADKKRNGLVSWPAPNRRCLRPDHGLGSGDEGIVFGWMERGSQLEDELVNLNIAWEKHCWTPRWCDRMGRL